MKKQTNKKIIDMETGKKEKFKKALDKVGHNVKKTVTNPKVVVVTTVAVAGAGMALYKTLK